MEFPVNGSTEYLIALKRSVHLKTHPHPESSTSERSTHTPPTEAACKISPLTCRTHPITCGACFANVFGASPR